MPAFEYDEAKSQSNLEKHGIDFLSAQELWRDLELLQIEARCDEEQRFLLIGQIDGRHWSAVVTYRSELIRLISVRRSRMSEVMLYENNRI